MSRDSIKIMDKFLFIIPKHFNRDNLINGTLNYLNKDLTAYFGGGFVNEYSVWFDKRDKSKRCVTSLNVSEHTLDNLQYTIIIECIDGFKDGEKEDFEKDTLMEGLLKEFNGVLVIKRYECENYSENKSTKYLVNYDKESIEYKLLNHYISKGIDFERALSMVLNIIEDKNILKELL